MPQMKMKHDVDPATDLADRVGDLSGVDIFFDKILVGLYVRPKTTMSGIHLADATVDEDLYQGKVALVLKVGDLAFAQYETQRVEVGDWIVFRPSNGLKMDINKTRCVLLRDIHVELRVKEPDFAW